jgi:lipoprotein-releasing system ATP-binding protein
MRRLGAPRVWILWWRFVVDLVDTHKQPVAQLWGVRSAYNLGKPNEVEVLHGIDLTLNQGEFCAVMGPSGSGKSTLLNIVGLLDRPTAGSISIGGEDTMGMDDHQLTRLRGHTIGFVFQYHHLITAFTALENVMMPMLGAAGFPNAQMRERAEALIASVGLKAWQDNLAGHLSGGQQQRVALARALAMNPALLLADEPTGNLDSKSAGEVFELLRHVNQEQGTAVLFVTHNAALAARCDKIIQVIDGRIVDGAGVTQTPAPHA